MLLSLSEQMIRVSVPISSRGLILVGYTFNSLPLLASALMYVSIHVNFSCLFQIYVVAHFVMYFIYTNYSPIRI